MLDGQLGDVAGLVGLVAGIIGLVKVLVRDLGRRIGALEKKQSFDDGVREGRRQAERRERAR